MVLKVSTDRCGRLYLVCATGNTRFVVETRTVLAILSRYIECFLNLCLSILCLEFQFNNGDDHSRRRFRL